MGLQFDRSGGVRNYSVTFAGDFEIQLPDITLGINRSSIISAEASSAIILWWLDDLNRIRFAGDSNIDIDGVFSVGDKLTGNSITRSGTTLTLTMGGETRVGSLTGSITFNLWGCASTGGNASKFTGLMEGIAVFIDNGTTVTTHDFEQAEGSIILPDTTGSNDADLFGFTGAGGFVAGAAVSSIAITSPTRYQCKKRSPAGTADFTVTGTIENLPTNSTVEYSLDGGTTWQVLDAAPSATFSGIVTITNQQDITVRLSGDITSTATVTEITAAMVIVAWWQSNENGRSTNFQTLDAGLQLTPIMYKGASFEPLADPVGIGSSLGSMWPKIASLYAQQGIPVCVMNVAVGGTPIARWKPSANDLYQTITSIVTSSGVGGVNISTSVGGEKDNVDNTPSVDFTADLNETINQIAADYGCLHYLTFYPKSDYPSNQRYIDAFNDVIANNANCRFGGDLQVLNILVNADPENDGVHIKTDADTIEAAEIRYTAFTTASSLLNMMLTGITDGTYPTRIINADSQQVVKFKDITWASGVASENLNIEVGVNTEYYAIGATEGGLQRGVTV